MERRNQLSSARAARSGRGPASTTSRLRGEDASLWLNTATEALLRSCLAAVEGDMGPEQELMVNERATAQQPNAMFWRREKCFMSFRCPLFYPMIEGHDKQKLTKSDFFSVFMDSE